MLTLLVKVYHDRIEKCKELAKKNPNDAQAHLSLGAAYFNSGMREETTELCKQAVRIDPDNIDAYHNLSIAYSELGMEEEGI